MANSSKTDEFDYFSEKISESSTRKTSDPVETTSDITKESTTTENKQQSQTHSNKAVYRTFTNIVVIGLGAVIGGYFGYNFMVQQDAEIAASSGTVSQVVVTEESLPTTPSDILDSEVARALVYFKQNNTFKGFSTTEPVASAANNESIVFVLEIDNTCYSNGIAQGYDSKTRVDPSGKRCLPKNLKKLQKIMNK